MTKIISYETVLRDAIQQLAGYHLQFEETFPSYVSEGSYLLSENRDWLASFWIGLLWHAYTFTDNITFRQHAERLLPTFEQRLRSRIRLNHDLGFLFTLSGRAHWQLTCDPQSRVLALEAAQELLQRYNPVGGYIQAWGEIGEAEEGGRFIIDCMLNIPLLFWASEQTGNMAFYEAALNHALTSQRYLMRADGSSYHTYFLDPKTGTPLRPSTHQGFADDSLWARGQAWAMMGFAIAAEWTGRADFLATASAAAHCFMREVPPHTIPCWDLRLPEDAPHYPDSSAAAIAACGMLRLAGLSSNEEASTFQQAAEALLRTLIEQSFTPESKTQGLLNNSTLHAVKGWGLDTPVIFGDYFFIEALMMCTHQAHDFWGKPK